MCLISNSGNIVLDVLEKSTVHAWRVMKKMSFSLGHDFRSLENENLLLHVLLGLAF